MTILIELSYRIPSELRGTEQVETDWFDDNFICELYEVIYITSFKSLHISLDSKCLNSHILAS